MPKILIIGPNYFNFASACGNGFKSLGWESYLELYDNPIHPFRGWLKLRHKLSPNKEKLKKKNRERYQDYIKKQFNKINPDMVLGLNGDMLLPKTLCYFRNKSKVAIWMFDSVKKVTVSQKLIDYVDAFFCYDIEDVNWYKELGKTAYFLPQACDTSLYYPINNIKKDIDILFVGTIYLSEKRERFLKAVTQHFVEQKVLFFGKYRPFVKRPLKSIFRKNRSVFKNRNINSVMVNTLYNRSKVVLNIHLEQQKNGANPKVFEIAGSGACQICDSNPYIESLFSNGEVGLYSNEQEMIALIEEALKKGCRDSTNAAYSIVLREHTFNIRMKELLNIVQSL